MADITNTALYIHESDAGNAIMCGIAAIPGIGGLASLARKSYNAFKTSKTGIKVINALKKYEGVEKILSSLRGKMKTGAKGLNKLSEGFESLSHRIKNLLKHGCIKKGRCFTGDTLVPTKHGYTAIKEIQKGDGILSRDEKTGRTGFKEVEDVFIRAVHKIYHVWLDGKEEIKTTAYHPVYVQEQGWVTAINLREGDTLETMEGTACITKIVKERHEEPVTVYNLAIKDCVSYFVGQVRVYVHNGIGYDGGSYSGRLIKLNNPDSAADALAVKIGGESRVKFANEPNGRKFDVVISKYIAQAKPDLSTYGKSWRKQTKATFEAAQETGRKAYFQFEGQPDASVIRKITEYGERYGVGYVIDTAPLGVKN